VAVAVVVYSAPRLIVDSFVPLLLSLARVAQVFAASTAWTPAFRQALEDHGLGSSEQGYAVPDGAAQLADLSWANVNEVSVRFNTGVNVALEHRAVRGLRVPGYTVTSFGYDSANFVATWTLLPCAGQAGTAAAAGDRLLLDLHGDSPNGADAYSSGDGAEGDDFRFQLNVLPGDVDRDGRVSTTDLYRVHARLSRSAAGPFSGQGWAYSPMFDIDGDGVIGPRDYLTVRAKLGSRLPAGLPAVVGSSNSAPLFAAVRTPVLTEVGGLRKEDVLA
jgi:hypothetical protein